MLEVYEKLLFLQSCYIYTIKEFWISETLFSFFFKSLDELITSRGSFLWSDYFHLHSVNINRPSVWQHLPVYLKIKLQTKEFL